MSTRQDTLGPAACRLARERLLELADECRARGRHRLAQNIEEASTRELDLTAARAIVVAPRLMPADGLGWDWLPQDWLVALCRDDGEFITYWTWPLPVRPS